MLSAKQRAVLWRKDREKYLNEDLKNNLRESQDFEAELDEYFHTYFHSLYLQQKLILTKKYEIGEISYQELQDGIQIARNEYAKAWADVHEEWVIFHLKIILKNSC